MASPAQTPPPKSSRARHQHSKSATPVAAGIGGKPAPRRQRNNRNTNNETNTTSPYQQGNGHNQTLQYTQDFYPFVPPNEYIETSGAVSEGPRPPNQRPGRHGGQAAPNNGISHTTLPSPPSNAKSPMVQGAVMTPAKSQAAYAGPTFHASPAPSALPVPKFFSKSVPATSSQPSLQSRLESEAVDPSPKPSPPSPPAAAITEPPRHEDSPLDLLFKADREEKAKRGSGLFTPNGKQSQAIPATQPLSSSASKNTVSHHSRHSSTGSGKGLFMMELDGGAAVPSRSSPRNSPAGSAPASRSVTAPSRIPQVGKPANPENDQQALKDLLFSLTQSKPNPPTSYASPSHVPSEPSSRFHTPSPFNQPRSSTRSTSGPITPVPQINDSANPPLFYGNRNLSPLFKATKTDSAKRSSSLRQEVTAASPIINQSGFPFAGQPESPINNMRRPTSNTADPRSMSQQYQNPAMTSPGSFGGPRPAYSFGQPQGSYNLNGSRDRPNNQIFQPNYQHVSPVLRTASAGPLPANMQSPSKTSSGYQATNPPEMKTMEDDLRRLLNIRGLDGNSAGVR